MEVYKVYTARCYVAVRIISHMIWYRLIAMQLLDVFLWVCPGGEFREGGAIQGLVFFHSRD